MAICDICKKTNSQPQSTYHMPVSKHFMYVNSLSLHKKKQKAYKANAVFYKKIKHKSCK